MNKRILIVTLFTILVAGCSESENSDVAENSTASGPSFPSLPTSSSERVQLKGKMAFWMYEGDAGCYGTITDGSSEVELWIDADSCGEREYPENEDASVEVTFNSENQYGPGKTYTITNFK